MSLQEKNGEPKILLQETLLQTMTGSTLDLPLHPLGRPLFVARREMAAFLQLQTEESKQNFAQDIQKQILSLRLLSETSLYFYQQGYSFGAHTSSQKWFEQLCTLPLFFNEDQVRHWEEEKPWKTDDWGLSRQIQNSYENLLQEEKISDAYCGPNDWLAGDLEKVWRTWLEHLTGIELSDLLLQSAEAWEQWLGRQSIPSPKWREQLNSLAVGLDLQDEQAKAWIGLECFLMPSIHGVNIQELGDFMNWAVGGQEVEMTRMLGRALGVAENVMIRLFEPNSILCQFGFVNALTHTQGGAKFEREDSQLKWPIYLQGRQWATIAGMAATHGNFPWSQMTNSHQGLLMPMNYESIWGHLAPPITQLELALKTHQAKILVVVKDCREESLFLTHLADKVEIEFQSPIGPQRKLDKNTLWLTQWISQMSGNGAVLIRALDFDGVDEKESVGVIRANMKQGLQVPWVVCVDNKKELPDDFLSLFDQVILLQNPPLQARLELTKHLFEDEQLGLRVARSLKSLSDILEAKKWCQMAGEQTWEIIQAHQHPRHEMKKEHSFISIFEIEEDLPPLASSPVFDGLMKRLTVIHKDPEKFIKMGAQPAKGTILIGPPGCGKTLFAKHLAKNLGVPCLQVNTVQVVENPVLLKEAFEVARAHAPCVLFFDEAAKIICKSSKVVEGLLTELDGMVGLQGVMVVATTNPLPIEDPIHHALLRPGRLNEHETIQLPKEKERALIWEAYLKTKPLKGDVVSTSQRLAKLSGSFSGADICEAVRKASIEVAMNDESELSMERLIKACDDLFWHYPSGQAFLPDVLHKVSIHEAGHALLGWWMKKEVIRITVSPRQQFMGAVLCLESEQMGCLSRERIHQNVMMNLGGIAAEKSVFGSFEAGGSSDLNQVYLELYYAITSYGMGSLGPISAGDTRYWSDQKRQQIETEMAGWSKVAMSHALSWLTEHQSLLMELANKLETVRDLSGSDLDYWKERVEKLEPFEAVPPAILEFQGLMNFEGGNLIEGGIHSLPTQSHRLHREGLSNNEQSTSGSPTSKGKGPGK